MRVVATKLGFYDGRRRQPGDEFTLRKGDKIGAWMKPAETSVEKQGRRAAPAPAATPPQGESEDPLA